jgi:hypothetical protein
MSLRSLSLISLFLIVVTSSCTDKTTTREKLDFPSLTTINVEDLKVLPIENSVILAQPIYLTKFDEESFLVYDSGVSKYFQFDTTGKKINEFGKAGRGPGEYSAFSGLSDMQRIGDVLLGVDVYQYLINMYDLNGDFLVSYPHEKTMKFNNVDFIDKNSMLQATNGAENSLAIIRELDSGDIVKRIGNPVAKYEPEMSIEEKRKAYEKKEIPSTSISGALVKNTSNNYILFMEALGELRFYSKSGKLVNTINLPDSLKNPLKEFVFKANADGRPGRVMELSYAEYIKVFNDNIFLFIPDFDVEENRFNTRLIISDLNGSFIKYIEFKNSENYRYFTDFIVTEDDTIIMIDPINSEIVYYPNF